VNDASDSSKSSRLKQRSGVSDSLTESCPASLESNPIRVVESGDPLETARQCDWVIEPIRLGLDPCSEGVLAIRMMSQGSYLTPRLNQELSETRALITECPGDQVHLGVTVAHGFFRRDMLISSRY